jgi:hypothetical protein
MKGIVRKAVALALSLAVQVAALGAPLVHAHPDEHATAHHNGRSMHTHWSGHERSHHHGDTPAFSTADSDRAVFLNVFVAVAAPHVAAPALPQAIFALLVPMERAAHRGVEVVRSHDPPGVSSPPLRAPPAFLS